jgi:sugar lactone lactonase YvrE
MKFLSTWLTPLIALLAYLLFWPVPATPVAWEAPTSAGYVGPHAPNARLAGLQQWPLQAGQEGPEHITTFESAVYTALANGDVVRFEANGQAHTLGNTGGRPLGLAITPEGTLYVADAMKGLLATDLRATGAAQWRVVLDKVDQARPDEPVAYADAVAVDARGDVWLTDASTRFGAKAVGSTFEASVLDILEGSCSGRLIVLAPKSGQKRVALHGLCFPNGIVFSQDGQSMFLSETGRYRILKIDLARLAAMPAAAGVPVGPTLQQALAQGAAVVLIDNLPGFPDNLTVGEGGRIWTGLTKPRSKIMDMAANYPSVRAMMLRLPRALWPVPPAYGHIIAFDESGKIVDDLQDPQGAYPETTAATELGGRLFVQSLHAHSVGWMNYSGPSVGEKR